MKSQLTAISVAIPTPILNRFVAILVAISLVVCNFKSIAISVAIPTPILNRFEAILAAISLVVCNFKSILPRLQTAAIAIFRKALGSFKFFRRAVRAICLSDQIAPIGGVSLKDFF